MFIVNQRKIFFVIAGILMVVAVALIMAIGLNLSIEFTGGSIVEVTYADGDRLTLSEAESRLENLNLGAIRLQEAGENGLIVRSKTLSEEEHAAVLNTLAEGVSSPITEGRFSSIGPSIGAELRQKSGTALILVIVLIILFIAYSFRKASKGVSSWKYGFVAIVALVHDVLIPTGVFVLLGHYFVSFQIDTLFVSALLAILGYSVNDTIVVFDRVRENVAAAGPKANFPEVVGKSLRQTMARSINTSLTTLLVLLALFFVGGETTRHFALVLAIGVLAGTYSSIFLAAPLLVSLNKDK